jgi:ankyrin repeat protein
VFLSQEGRTALIWAAKNGHTEVVKALIEGDADVEAKEKVRRRRCVSTEVGGLERMSKFLFQHVGSLQTN